MSLRELYKKLLSYKFNENINLTLKLESESTKFINLTIIFYRVYIVLSRVQLERNILCIWLAVNKLGMYI